MGERRIRVLVVDDEAAMREVLEMRLTEWGHEVHVAATPDEAERMADRLEPDVVLSDVVLPGVSGIELLRRLQAGDPGRPVILITAHGSIDDAVEAMKLGARDFLTKPLDYTKLRLTLEAASREARQRRASQALDRTLAEGAGLGPLVGTSAAMQEVYGLIRAVAGSDASVIVTGESGTGKELVARAIHSLSRRAAGAFVPVNLAAVPEGLVESELFGHEKGAFTGAQAVRRGCFELADGGTLFLDEITEMPAMMQPKLLRVLEGAHLRRVGGSQEIGFDVRVIAATNRDPEQAAEQGLLRRDLYYRLNVFAIALPPLRERDGDVPLLVQHLLGELNRKHGASVRGLDGEALSLLLAYPWPGNVRELRNVIERAVILARDSMIAPNHLPPYLRTAPAAPVPPASGATVPIPEGATAEQAERILILTAIERAGGNKAEAARRLGLDVKTIRNKLRQWAAEPGSR